MANKTQRAGSLNLAPRILVAEYAGSCFGVNRALDLVKEAASIPNHQAEESGNTTPASAAAHVHTLGPLIHNPRVVNELAERGVTCVDTPEQAAGQTIVLRTHGVAPEVEEAARRLCATVIDATCPFVKRAHHAAERLARENYQVIVVGERGHAEAEATLARASAILSTPKTSVPQPASQVEPTQPAPFIAATPDDLHGKTLARRVGLVVQTTMTPAALQDLVDVLAPQVDELRVFNTICDATEERQTAAIACARHADVMFVLGGKNSANTRHLAQLCLQECPATYHIESSAELDPSWLNGAATIGITAGASTPQSHIHELEHALENLITDQLFAT